MLSSQFFKGVPSGRITHFCQKFEIIMDGDSQFSRESFFSVSPGRLSRNPQQGVTPSEYFLVVVQPMLVKLRCNQVPHVSHVGDDRGETLVKNPIRHQAGSSCVQDGIWFRVGSGYVDPRFLSHCHLPQTWSSPSLVIPQAMILAPDRCFVVVSLREFRGSAVRKRPAGKAVVPGEIRFCTNSARCSRTEVPIPVIGPGILARSPSL